MGYFKCPVCSRVLSRDEKSSVNCDCGAKLAWFTMRGNHLVIHYYIGPTTVISENIEVLITPPWGNGEPGKPFEI